LIRMMNNTRKKYKAAVCLASLLLLIVICTLFSRLGDLGGSDHLYRNDHAVKSELYFSKPSGFYDQDFPLLINAPTEEIYYTIDGSEPDYHSTKYTEPLWICDASQYANVHSARTDLSAGFLTEYIDKVGGAKLDFSTPEGLVDKCTIVRAVYYDENGNRSDVITGTFFVGFQEKEAYRDIKVLSIVTEPGNLFDYNTGIYVLGKTFDDFVANNGLSSRHNSTVKYWQWWEANYRNKGSNWERPATLQIFDQHNNIVLTQDVGIRIQGGGSRGYITKSMNVYAREQYGGNTKIHYDFWDTGYLPDVFTISSSGDDMWAKMRDRLISELSDGMSFSAMHYEPCMLFLDGEFWGFFYITEKYNETYIQETYQVNASNVVSMKNTEQEMGTVDCLIAYQRWLHFMDNNDFAIPANYEKACQLMDMESTIDYLAVEAYIGRSGDWFYEMHNTHIWRSIEQGTGQYEDQKWRWMLFDQNSGGASENLTGFNSIALLRERSPMVDSLCTNKMFAEALATRILEIGQNQFSAENVVRTMDEYIVQTQAAMDLHRMRYGLDQEMINKEIASIRNFFVNRFPNVVSMLKEEFPDLNVDAILQQTSNLS